MILGAGQVERALQSLTQATALVLTCRHLPIKGGLRLDSLFCMYHVSSRSLAELVRAMKLKSGVEDDLKEDTHHHHQLPSVDNHHHQLPSILETDPAVAQAVRSAEPFYPQPMLPQVGPRTKFVFF